MTTVLVDLGEMPLANDYPATEVEADRQPRHPLRPYVCERCFLVQLSHDVAPAEIFQDYTYFSSYSDSWVEHARRFAVAAQRRFDLGPDDLVVEVASNDGYLLQHFSGLGLPVLGIEPAANVAEVAVAAGVPTVVEFFGRASALQLREAGHRASLLVGNNVIAHVPDLHDFVDGLAILVSDEGIVSLEFPHLVEFLAAVQFDTLYHEHFSYLSLLALEPVLAAHGLRVFDIERLATHGGSVRVSACLVDAHHEEQPGVADVRAIEAAAGLHRIGAYERFAALVERCRESARAFVGDALAKGERIVGYGAAAKGVTFLNYCGFGPDEIAYVVDRSLAKQGRLIPGVKIPILAPEEVLRTQPDHLLILPWNLREEIAEQMAQVRTWGCDFVTAVPVIEVFE